ncbi:MAG: methyltransferase domain-containing protein [Nitrososphaeria archaeon]
MRINADFELCSILESEFDDSFDVVYAKEFISHVHPVPQFIKVALKYLKSGGYIIISDTNPLNPLTRYLAYKEHRKGLYKIVKNPVTGSNVLYAVERLISPYTLIQLLRSNGFFVVDVSFYVWPGPSALLPLIKIIEEPLKFPITPIYTITAIKV